MKILFATGLTLGLLATVVPASAATVVFSGSRANVDAPGPAAARCLSRATANIVNNPPTSTSSGLSNLGAFTPTLSHCIQLPLAMAGPTIFDLGEFVFDFGLGNTLLGTYSGSVTPNAPGLFSIFQTHIVTGGTGFFAGATGAFDSSGTLSFLTGQPTVNQTFAGTLNVAAIPEPSTWMMMIGGFALVGRVMRVRRRKQRVSAAYG